MAYVLNGWIAGESFPGCIPGNAINPFRGNQLAENGVHVDRLSTCSRPEAFLDVFPRVPACTMSVEIKRFKRIQILYLGRGVNKCWVYCGASGLCAAIVSNNSTTNIFWKVLGQFAVRFGSNTNRALRVHVVFIGALTNPACCISAAVRPVNTFISAVRRLAVELEDDDLVRGWVSSGGPTFQLLGVLHLIGLG